MNRIKYGLKNVHYAIATIAADGSATYTAPKAWPGAVNLSMDPEGDTNKFFADNIAYATINTNAGYSGSLESALVPDDFRKEVLGDIESGKVLIEDANAPVVHFALLFQFEGDSTATKHVMYNCTASRPSVSGATSEESAEVQTESVDLTATSVYNEALGKNIIKAKLSDSTDENYDTWFTNVFQPTA